MKENFLICRRRKIAFSAALALLVISGLLAAFAPGGTAAVRLLYFKATAGSDRILLEWETATERDTLGFRLYRSKDSAAQGSMIGDPFPAEGSVQTGAKYSYTDTDVVRGEIYYYSVEELASIGGGVEVVATASAGIDVATLTPTFTPTATATATATTGQVAATRTPTATGVPGTSSGDQPTATRQFTNTPQPAATADAGVTPVPGAATVAPPTAAPIGPGVVSTPTGLPQPPATATAVSASDLTPSPPAATAPPAPPTPSPSPEIVAMSAIQPALELTPKATQPPQVFAAATTQPLLGTPGRAVADPTPATDGETPRNTGTIFLLGGGAILLAAALGGGVLLYLRSRQP